MGIGWLLAHGPSKKSGATEARDEPQREMRPADNANDDWLRRVALALRGPVNNTDNPPPASAPTKPPASAPVKPPASSRIEAPPPIPPKAPPSDDAEVAGVTFEKQVMPILQTRCAACHNAAKRKGGLDVRSVASLLKGGNSGPAITPGSLDKSVLWETIAADQMPPGRNKLSPAEKAIIQKWIVTSARDGRVAEVQAAKP
jgi:hypothetical protein